MLSGFLALGFMLPTDALFWVFLSHITTQFDLLAIRLKKMFYVPLDEQLIKEYPLGNIFFTSSHSPFHSLTSFRSEILFKVL